MQEAKCIGEAQSAVVDRGGGMPYDGENLRQLRITSEWMSIYLHSTLKDLLLKWIEILLQMPKVQQMGWQLSKKCPYRLGIVQKFHRGLQFARNPQTGNTLPKKIHIWAAICPKKSQLGCELNQKVHEWTVICPNYSRVGWELPSKMPTNGLGIAPINSQSGRELPKIRRLAVNCSLRSET